MVVWAVTPGSPAERGGIAVGDHLTAIDGVPTRGLTAAEAWRSLKSDEPGAVSITVERNGTRLAVALTREPREVALARMGKRIHRDIVVPNDTTDDEVAAMAAFDGTRVIARVFPLHYPTDVRCFSGGFEIFVLKGPAEVAVGGIEPGPASRAGLHWGDRIVSVNGAALADKSVPDLEALFCKQQPVELQLVVQRMGESRRIAFVTERADALLNANGLRLVGGSLVPTGVSSADADCLNASE